MSIVYIMMEQIEDRLGCDLVPLFDKGQPAGFAISMLGQALYLQEGGDVQLGTRYYQLSDDEMGVFYTRHFIDGDPEVDMKAWNDTLKVACATFRKM